MEEGHLNLLQALEILDFYMSLQDLMLEQRKDFISNFDVLGFVQDFGAFLGGRGLFGLRREVGLTRGRVLGGEGEAAVLGEVDNLAH